MGLFGEQQPETKQQQWSVLIVVVFCYHERLHSFEFGVYCLYPWLLHSCVKRITVLTCSETLYTSLALRR